MTPSDYQDRQAAIFSIMERHKGTHLPPLSATLVKHLARVGALIGQCVAALMGASLMWGSTYALGGKHLLSVALVGTAMGVVLNNVGFWLGGGNEAFCSRFFHYWPHWFGRGIMIEPSQAHKVVGWCKEHPRMAQACEAWASQNRHYLLTSREYAMLEKTSARLKRLEDKWESSLKERASNELTLNILNEDGLLDRARMMAESKALEKDTASPQAVAPVRRI